jgi:copper homeostasis protein
MPSKRARILEVIVTSLRDAIEAEQGGADRLEVVRDLDSGGLTPDILLVRRIVEAVRIPIRIMLRENSSMSLLKGQELDILLGKAVEMSAMALDGLVMGFVWNDQLDARTLRTIADVAPNMKITFHRAFDVLPDPLHTIRTLKTIPQVDRILTTGGPGSWPARKLRLHCWQRHAAPEITIIAGAGLLKTVIRDLSRDSQISEMHIGRAARIPPETTGQVSRIQVAQLKGRRA